MSLIEEIERRARRAAFTLESFLFDRQLAVTRDRSRFLTVDCSRRSGKTDLAAGALLDGALRNPGSLELYVAPTQVDARDNLWGRIKQVNDQFHLGFTPNEVRLNLTHPNKSEIRLRGAKDEGQAQHLRGPPQGYSLAILDEAQNMGASIKTVIADVLLPAATARGVRGRIWVMGTPSLVPVGFWHDLVHSDGSWSHHHWTIRDNPHISDVEETLADAARLLGGVDSPAFQREWLGLWVADPSALVFQFDAVRNYFDELPSAPMQTVMGVDLGHHPDSSAIDVEGWFPSLGRELYGVDEWVKGNVDIDDVADAIEERIERFNPLAIVIDEGGLGKMIAETLRRRRGLAVYPAEKTDKNAAISVLNSDMRRGLVKVRRGSRAAHDMAVVKWDKRAKDEHGKLKIASRPHSDIMDAKLYAHRRALHYLQEMAPKKRTDADRLDAWERKELERIERKKTGDWWEGAAVTQGFDV